MRNIKMVDLHSQHDKIHAELTEAITEVIENSSFINGPQVSRFKDSLASFLGVRHVIPCANGTDALQIVLMALDLPAGSEVILPSFNYIAAAEVVVLLDLQPVFADVDPFTFNVSLESIKAKITERTRVILPVHLFGQCADMEQIIALATENNLIVVEDAAQAMGGCYKFSDGTVKHAGTMGIAGISSFFPTKNLGGMGDGGAIFTNNEELAQKMSMIANHGQKERYNFVMVGMNSRLDTIQAAVLNVKLKYLKEYIERRRWTAEKYSDHLKNIEMLKLPETSRECIHSWNQYTLQVQNGKRDRLKQCLADKNIPFMIYYPLPLHHQPAYRKFNAEGLSVSENLCKIVISLPMHTELDEEQIAFIASSVRRGLEAE